MAGNVNHAKQLQLNVSIEIQTHSPIEEFQYSQIVMEATYSKLLLLPHKKAKSYRLFAMSWRIYVILYQHLYSSSFLIYASFM